MGKKFQAFIASSRNLVPDKWPEGGGQWGRAARLLHETIIG